MKSPPFCPHARRIIRTLSATRLRPTGRSTLARLPTLDTHLTKHLPMNTSQLRAYLKTARFYQLNITQAESLCVVAEHRNMTVGALAIHVGVTTAAITHIADTLVRLGYIDRRNGISDRRHIWLDITPLGEAVLNNILRKTPVSLELAGAKLATGKMASAC